MNNINEQLLSQYPLLIPAKEAGRIIGMRPGTVKKYLDEGRFPLPVRRLGRNRVVRRDDVLHFIDELFDRKPSDPTSPSTTKRGPGRPRKSAPAQQHSS